CARVIAASATVSNIGDISCWLGEHGEGGIAVGSVPAKTLVFGDEYRPVPLSKTVLGFECNAAYYKFQRNLDFKLPGIINTHCPGSPTLVFCATRGAAQDTCRFLARNIGQLSHRPMPLHLTTPFTNQLLNAPAHAPTPLDSCTALRHS
ncbi:ATP-dependent DNA helicase MER3, partial [Coemansia biformis]